MSRRLTASDRSALIRLASTMPAGSDERRAILSGLRAIRVAQREYHVGQRVTLMDEGYFKPSDGRYSEWLNAGTKGVITGDGGDWKGPYYLITVNVTPGKYADDPTPYKRTYTVPAPDEDSNSLDITSWR